MKKFVMITTLLLMTCVVFAQGNPNPLPRSSYSTTETIQRSNNDSRMNSTRVFDSGATSTGGVTSTITTEIDSVAAPGTNTAAWVAVIYSVDGVIEWDTSLNFAGAKTIYMGVIETTAMLNKGILPKIYLRRKSGQTATLNYSISTYGY